MKKIECPICKRGVETILNKDNKIVFQKHIGVGFWRYGQSKGNICFSSFKDITTNNLPKLLKDENEIMKKMFPPKILTTEFQADNKIQVSARKSTNNNPESKTRGENDETIN